MCKKSGINRIGNHGVWIILFFFFICFSEVFLFNFRFWESIHYETTDIPMSEPEAVTDEAGNTVYRYVYSTEGSVIKTVGFVTVPVMVYYSKSGTGHDTTICLTKRLPQDIKVRYIAGDALYTCPEYKVSYSDSDFYVYTIPNDLPTDSILIESPYPDLIRAIRINTPVPFHFSIFRIAVLLICGSTIFFFGKADGFLWKTPFFTPEMKVSKTGRRGMILIALLSFLLLIWLGSHNPILLQAQDLIPFYPELVKALAKGNLYLDVPVPEGLLAMEDPYDWLARAEAGLSREVPMDFAYYKEHFYCYYGIVPCVLFYLLPYTLFGYMVSTVQVTGLLVVLYLVGAAFFAVELYRRYCPERSCALFFAGYIILIATMPFSCMVASMLLNYWVPLFSAIVLLIYGLGLFLLAFRKSDEGKEKLWLLSAASLCIALIAGCRPQIALAVIILSPQLITYIKKSQHKRKTIAAITIPVLIVAVCLMGYNYARFESPTEFGFRYNLTTGDVHSGISVEGIRMGLWDFLFHPVRWAAGFPYIDYSEDYGFRGVMLLCPVLFLAFAFVLRKWRNGEMRMMTVLSFVFGIFLAVLAGSMVGVLFNRYRMDFMFFFAVATVLVLWGLRVKDTPLLKGKPMKIIKLLLAGLLLECILVALPLFFEPAEECAKEYNPAFYYELESEMCFWR